MLSVLVAVGACIRAGSLIVTLRSDTVRQDTADDAMEEFMKVTKHFFLKFFSLKHKKKQ